MGNPLLNLTCLAGVILISLNWPKREFVWIFNFQHYLFPAHTDDCGFLKPKLSNNFFLFFTKIGGGGHCNSRQ